MRVLICSVLCFVSCSLGAVPGHSPAESAAARRADGQEVLSSSSPRVRLAARRTGPGQLAATAARSLARPRVALLNDAEAWKRLPRAMQGGGRPLPAWARALAPTLPRTTAAMLELDYLQRAGSPLDPVLRGRIRWVAARANRCRYGEAYAEADLRRAGMDEAGLRQLANGGMGFSGPDKTALAFARKLTVAANTITDAEVAELIAAYGEQQVVAIVLLVAYANFQDRLVLALDLPLEPGGPLGPLDVRFEPAPPGASPDAPVRKAPVQPAAGRTDPKADPGWKALDFAHLRQELEKQRGRRSRIQLPDADPDDIRWGRVCKEYQPRLSAAWAACMRWFGAEANQDPIFEESVLWVITQSVHCFY